MFKPKAITNYKILTTHSFKSPSKFVSFEYDYIVTFEAADKMSTTN